MADNVTTPATGSGDATPKIATDQIPGTLEHYQKMKIADGTADSTTIVPATTVGDASSASIAGLWVNDQLMVYNGTTWDRLRSVGGIGDGASTGIPLAGNTIYNGASWDRLRTVVNGDGQALTGLAAAGNLAYNGTTWDRLRNIPSLDAAPNVDTGILAAGIGPGWDRKLNPANLGTAANSAITQVVDGSATTTFFIGTTTTGTITFEVSGDDAAWIAADALDVATDTWVSGQNLTPTNLKVYFVRTGGYRQVRVRTVTTLGATVAVKTTGTTSHAGPDRVNLFGPGNFSGTQVNITNSAATLVIARPTRKRCTLVNRQAEAVFIGAATVTTAAFQLDPGAAYTFESTALLQGITTNATINSALKVHIADEYY